MATAMSCLEVRCEALPRRELPICPVCLREIGPTDRDDVTHAACDHARAVRRSTHQPLVLVVDDNDDLRTMYAMYLQSSGFRVIEAPDGTTAIGKARARRPDVILLDLFMPGLNGWQACRWLKSTDDTANIPVIVLTAYGTISAEQEARAAGCDRFLVKGANPEHVVRAISDVLSRA
jgi:CheY-like chemotaxis protein